MTPNEMLESRRAIARRFLQSALLIDDDLELASEDTGFLVANVPTGTAIPKPTAAVLATPSPPKNPAVGQAQKTKARVDAKAITDAFLELSVICGIFRPGPDDDATTMSVGAASHADILIVDWFLEGGSPERAKNLIRRLLKDDAKRRDRLRLIVIYTSNPGRALMAQELLGFLEGDDDTAGRFQLDGTRLRGHATSVVFLNKEGTTGGDAEALSEAALPDRVLSEFVTLIDGLLPTFAVAALAVIREAAPHVLSLFNRNLDGAFVGHRAVLEDPDDANVFLTDLVSDELRNVIDVNEVASKYLGPEAVSAWLASRQQRMFGKTIFADDDLEKIVREGNGAFKAAKQRKAENPAADANQQDRIRDRDLGRIFYETDAAALSSNMRLARMATFRNEAFAETRMPKDWLPYLSLGSVLKRTSNQSDTYLICLQPACDSVRLTGDTAFPFQVAEPSEAFNIVLKHQAQGDGVKAKIRSRPRDGEMIVFACDPTKKRVLAQRSPDGAAYAFIDKNGASYEWIGDLKALKAQSIAGQVGSRMNSVGLNDLEWLRINARGAL